MCRQYNFYTVIPHERRHNSGPEDADDIFDHDSELWRNSDQLFCIAFSFVVIADNFAFEFYIIASLKLAVFGFAVCINLNNKLLQWSRPNV